jgi:hypothetical protein
VAGVAGLVLSKYGHPEYTFDSLKSKILEAADNIDASNKGKEWRLGAGRLNAFKALLSPDSLPPGRPLTIWTDDQAYYSDLGLITPIDNTIAPFKYSVELRSSDLDTSLFIFDSAFPNPEIRFFSDWTAFGPTSNTHLTSNHTIISTINQNGQIPSGSGQKVSQSW